MIPVREFNKSLIFQEMNSDQENLKYWFDFKQQKFLHNIDTFYFSVKLVEDFTDRSEDRNVFKFRKYFQSMYERLDNDSSLDFIPVDIFKDSVLNLRRFSFAYMYNICLEFPEWFDMFIAPKVPRGSTSESSVTCEIVVQIRSYMLWVYGVHHAFEKAFQYVLELCDYFGLHVDFCQENRIDYCWHSNYLVNPEQFFSLENFYKMRVDRFHDAVTHTEKVGSEGFEIDYIALGKRSDKVFIRIYLKSKEVIEQGYKGWFFYIWMFNGLINRYDLYCFEECYKRRSWRYLNLARCSFYLEHGSDPEKKEICAALLSGARTMEEDVLQRFADELTPKVNLIMNVEYQTMRRHSKSYQLIPFHDNSNIPESTKRIYEYFDNHKLIIDYLTFHVLRLVTPSGDSNKSRRELCGFWKKLRSTRLVDVKLPPKHLELIRKYSRNLNADLVKTRAINSAITYSIYRKGVNDDDVINDMIDALCTLNDNDIQKALRYKEKKTRQFNKTELSGQVDTSESRFGVVDLLTGALYGYDNMV